MKEAMPKIEKRELKPGDVLEFISKRGKDDPEFKDILGRWLEQEEEKAGNTPHDRIEFNVKRADFYRQAGLVDPFFFDGALENLEHAWEQASNEGSSQWLTRLKREFERLEAVEKMARERKAA